MSSIHGHHHTPNSPLGMRTLCAILEDAVAAAAEKPLFTYPASRWNDADVLTYGRLFARSMAAANAIGDWTRPGDRAVLVFPTGAEFWEAFFGCLFRRVVAVPLAIPNFRRDAVRFEELCRDCAPSVLIMDEATVEQFRRSVAAQSWLGQLSILTPDQWRDEAGACRGESPRDEDLAILQYTSGSTARPKGVQITHANVVANLQMIRDRMGIRPYEDSGVTWLPHYHDMGLVGSCLATLFTRNTTICLRPEDFLVRPLRWLEMISEHRATICGGPDFAYRYCVEKIPDEPSGSLDLASWRIAYVGAERVRADTLRRFTERFSRHGFRQTSFFPCYGLGEATLMATGGPPQREPTVRRVSAARLRAGEIRPPDSAEDVAELVGSGQVGDGCRVVILDPSSNRPLGDEVIGEVLVSGPSVTKGYFRGGALNESLFIEVAQRGTRESFLRTGDLGFLSAGELFITGRLKELMIIRGRNLVPEDVEQAVRYAHDALEPGGVAAFSVDASGEETLIIAAELRRAALKAANPRAIVAAVRENVVAAAGVDPGEILLLRPGTIPRTTSGKLQRLALRDQYLQNDLGPLLVPGERNG